MLSEPSWDSPETTMEYSWNRPQIFLKPLSLNYPGSIMKSSWKLSKSLWNLPKMLPDKLLNLNTVTFSSLKYLFKTPEKIFFVRFLRPFLIFYTAIPLGVPLNFRDPICWKLENSIVDFKIFKWTTEIICNTVAKGIFKTKRNCQKNKKKML